MERRELGGAKENKTGVSRGEIEAYLFTDVSGVVNVLDRDTDNVDKVTDNSLQGA